MTSPFNPIITEYKLQEFTGYTKNQIRMRRVRHWLENKHFAKDPAGVYVYDLGEIQAWQKTNIRASERKEAQSRFTGCMRGEENSKASISPIRPLT